MDENKIQQAEKDNRKSFLGKMFAKGKLRFVSIMTLAMSLLCMSAFAADGDTTVAGVLSEATPVLTTATGSVWTLMTSNPVCKFALGCAVLAVGFRFLRKAIRISHKA